MADNKFGLGRVQSNLKKMQIELPRILANQAQNYFTSKFQTNEWEGEPWKVPQRRIEGTPEYKYPKFKGLSRRIKPTLTLTGTLRRAVSNSIRLQTMRLIRLVVALPYAKRHNEGLDDMPKRTYMGDGPTLRRMQTQKISDYITKIWK